MWSSGSDDEGEATGFAHTSRHGAAAANSSPGPGPGARLAVPSGLRVGQGPVTPSKVRYEVESLRRQHLISKSDEDALLTSAGPANGRHNRNREVTSRVMDVCAQIREAKGRVGVGLLEPDQFREHKRRLIDSVRRSAATASRRGRSYTRQIIMATAAKQEEQRKQQQQQAYAHALRPNHQQEHGGEGGAVGSQGSGDAGQCVSGEDFSLPGDGEAQTTKDNDDGEPNGSSGDEAYDASLEFLREMGVEISQDEMTTNAAAKAAVAAATSAAARPSSSEHAVTGAADRDDEEENARAFIFSRGDHVQVVVDPARVEVSSTLPALRWFSWNRLKREKAGKVGIVVGIDNADQGEDSALPGLLQHAGAERREKQEDVGAATGGGGGGGGSRVHVRFPDELRFWFPASFLRRVPKSSPAAAGVDGDRRDDDPFDTVGGHDARARDITAASAESAAPDASSWTPSAVAHFVQQLGRKRLWTTYARALLREEVDGATLREAEVEDLVEYGISRLHARKILARFRAALSEEARAVSQDEGAIFKYLRTADRSVAYLEDVIGQVCARFPGSMHACVRSYREKRRNGAPCCHCWPHAKTTPLYQPSRFVAVWLQGFRRYPGPAP
eukprot:INCI4101.5.p1 GENE.INCI4101.5~~INCI4101.5.p1  ORF type:complete len:616 (-),score=129.32 INCI4101.5:2370-4217(-)